MPTKIVVPRHLEIWPLIYRIFVCHVLLLMTSLLSYRIYNSRSKNLFWNKLSKIWIVFIENFTNDNSDHVIFILCTKLVINWLRYKSFNVTCSWWLANWDQEWNCYCKQPYKGIDQCFRNISGVQVGNKKKKIEVI